ncbi:hypothetical protein Q73A0000_12570 [Kaistella flava (ex Peng et al. 2021)]|uniref:Uncharacterized protein n=1 Tax=Kaistella flava (ex Peng et al. 2021) TaxID=2038776 RepID=A0A7M2YCF4_9FLAO|nr:hypothetical protein [Kaistella flava (ex Peng et al. 2021)]QOW11132.1 hypothetical protein Q73A0000_12570 [Kaistella flava (ex Peng et al. 2021)]
MTFHTDNVFIGQAKRRHHTNKMRTEQLKIFEENLSELNDCYSHYIFVWEQFIIDQKENLKNHSQKSTTEIFSKNLSSKQFNVSLDYLDKSHNGTQNLILKSIYQLAYGYFENYLIRLHQFGQKLNPEILDLQQKMESEDIEDKKIFDKFLNRLDINVENLFEPLEITTLDYIRLRRNRITHRSISVQGLLLDIINNHGTKLNDFWDESLKNKRYKVDFKRKNVDDFDKLELFDFLNIYRKIALKIDNEFINKIGLNTFIKYFLDKFMEANEKSIKGFKEERKKAKFKMYCKVDFGLDISDYELRNIAF